MNDILSPVSSMSLSTDAAIEIARRSVALCADRGFAVAATVVDRSGNVLAAARANEAGSATLDGSRRKAFTAINMGMSSGEVERLIRENPMLRALGDIDEFLPLQGAVLIKSGDRFIGAVGVGGATGEVDEESALAAIEQVFARNAAVAFRSARL